MLKLVYPNFVKKECYLPPLQQSTTTQVLVDVTNPVTGESLGSRTEEVETLRTISDADAVRRDTADMYSIETMNKIGIPPVVCNGQYVKQGLDSLDKYENLSANLLLQVQRADALKKESELSTAQPFVEPLKTTE